VKLDEIDRVKAYFDRREGLSLEVEMEELCPEEDQRPTTCSYRTSHRNFHYNFSP